ncbi:hypothetical protein, partial [Salinicola socius]
SLLSPNAVVNVGACKLYQTPGVTFCTNNKDENGNDTGTENCSTVWNAESTGETNNPDSDAPTISDSPFQLTSDPSSCSKGSYTSGSNTYCYTGQSSDINTIHIDQNGQVIDDSDNGGNSGGSDGGSSGGGTDSGSDTGSGGSGGGGSSGGGSGSGGSTGGGSGSDGGSTGGDSGSGGGSGGGGSSGGGSGSGGSTGGDSGSDGGSSGGDSDSGNDDGDGLGAVLDAIGSVRKAINDGFNNLVDTFTNQDGAPSGDDVVADFDGQGLSDDLMAEAETQNDGIQGELTQRYQDLFESDSSILGSALNSVRDTATSWLP